MTGQIITFYSYKGGTGRSMALANIATLLTGWGYRVLMIDWDLEAPGLEFFFRPFVSGTHDLLEEREGIVDLLGEHLAMSGRPARARLSWRDMVYEIHMPHGRAVHLLTAGRRDRDYFKAVTSLSVEDLYANNGGMLIESLRAEWKAVYDFVLVDSRTGITDIGGICTIQLPDSLVLLLTPTDQALEGVERVYLGIRSAQEQLPLDRQRLLALPVISRIDVLQESKLLQEWLKRCAERLNVVYANWLHSATDPVRMLEATKLPHIPFFSFGEKLSVIEEGTSDSARLGYAYENLAALIANRHESSNLLLDDRDYYVRLAKQRRNRTTTRRLVSLYYSHGDQSLKDRVEVHFEPLKQKGALETWNDGQMESSAALAETVDRSDAIIFLLSPDFLASDFITRQELREIFERRMRDGVPILPILLRECLWDQVPLIRDLEVWIRDRKPLERMSIRSAEIFLADFAKEATFVLTGEGVPRSRTPARDAFVIDVQQVEELDRFRATFAGRQTIGVQALAQFAEALSDKRARQSKGLVESLRDRAQALRALCECDAPPDAVQELLGALISLPPARILGDPANSHVFHVDDSIFMDQRFLDAAYLLDALANAPGGFSSVMMIAYYVVVRELYDATPPFWVVGGARAGEGGRPSAFVTGQIVRAILGFASMFEREALYVDVLAGMSDQRTTAIDEWNRMEADRHLLSFYTALVQNSQNLPFATTEPPDTVVDLLTFEARVRRDLAGTIAAADEASAIALHTIAAFRHAETTTALGRSRYVDRSQSAHAIAYSAIQDACQRARQARELFASELPIKHLCVALAHQFRSAAAAIRRLMVPAVDYLSNVLGTQLALADAPEGLDVIEIAAAASTLGYAQGDWSDQRLHRAVHVLGTVLAHDAVAFPQTVLAVVPSNVQPLRQHLYLAYAEILEHVDVELSSSVLTRVARFFDRNINENEGMGGERSWDHASQSPKSAYQIAVSTIALERLCRMLDQRINTLVLKHFTTKKPAIKLDELFYPDYGLASVHDEEHPSRLSIALVLERMRAALVRVPLRPRYSEPIHSVVIHGPPGTGKLSFLEALAGSAGVPLVVVTPADIVAYGTEAIDQRARDVLRILSFLTHAVILFDEFDQILTTRGEWQQGAPITPFITPIMLSRLVTLHDAAAERQIAFALVTNAVVQLDPAAIRSGRFDMLIGIYPPDVLARYGRLFTEVELYLRENDIKVPKDLGKRFVEAIKVSRGWSIQGAGSRGWFTRPKGPVREETLFGFLLGMSAHPPEFAQSAPASVEEDQYLWSVKERADWKKLEALEKEQDDFSKTIWAAVRSAFISPAKRGASRTPTRPPTKRRRSASRTTRSPRQTPPRPRSGGRSK